MSTPSAYESDKISQSPAPAGYEPASGRWNTDDDGEKGSEVPEVPVRQLDPDFGKSAAEKAEIDKHLLHRIDMHLIPWLCLLYLLAFLDRTNIGNAKIDGLPDHLGLDPGQFNASLSIFFVSYALFEPLTNMLLKTWRPSVFIPFIIIMWGICMTLMGIVENYPGLLASRWFLGLFEAGLFPGVNYYLSCWYRRSEFGIRAAIFFSAAAAAGSFGGLLAAAIIQFLEGVAGLHGWQWIFILEGIATVVTGVASCWLVYDFPERAKFLTMDDRRRVLYRLSIDRPVAGAEPSAFQMKFFWNAISDPKMYIGMMIYMGADMALYAFSLFLPSIIVGLQIGSGSVTANQLLSVPPYMAAAVLTVLVGWIADKTGQRGICNMVCSSIGIVGFTMLLASSDRSYGVKYTGTFLGALGIYPCIANTISWVSCNIEGSFKRGIILGCVIGWGNLNGVVSSNIYRAVDAPGYKIGHAVVLFFLTVCIFGGSLINYVYLRHQNFLKSKFELSNWPQHKIDELGDLHPDFVYSL